MNSFQPLKNRDIVVVGQQPWDIDLGSNCKNIADEFAKYNRVLYVNSPLDRITKMKHKNDPKVQRRIRVVQKKEPGLVKIKSNLWNLYPDRMIESINWIKNQSIFEALNLYNNKKLAKSILAALKELNFSDIILFNDNDMFRCYHLPELLKPAVSIYYSRDFMLAVDYWRVHGEKMEPELIAKNNVCVANSTYLANYCRKYNPLSFYVGQGCELDMFMHVANTSTPADMQAIQSPIIGYVGALMHIRLDMEVLKHIAQQRPNWQIVLVGPEDEEFKASDLHQLPNIHFLGSKPVADLPQYINAFDVCINPQLVNQVTIGNYPRKIDEYLAVGKPVVATNTEAMSIFKDYTYLADSKEAYVSLIEQALAENNAEKVADRKTFAASHSWENSVQAIYNAIQSYENPSLQN